MTNFDPLHPIKCLKRIWTAKDRYESADVVRRANQFYLHFSSRHYSESLAASNATTQHWICEWNSVEMYLKRLLTACQARSVLDNEAFAINSKLLFNLVVLMHLPSKCMLWVILCKHVLLALIKSSKCSNLFVLFFITKASVVYKMEIKSYI